MFQRPTVILAVFVALAWGLYDQWPSILAWTSDTQRRFQNVMASSLRAVQSGDAFAVVTLCAATFLYGLVHAAGPGHGKIVLGASAVASRAGILRMVLLSFFTAIAQALSAILLIGLIVVGLRWIGGSDAVKITEDWLSPISFVLFAAFGGVLLVRGTKMVSQYRKTAVTHRVHCNHKHGPNLAEVDVLKSSRDSLLLTASIAVRPCTGALFLLVIAAQLDVFWLGAIATLAMGVGTAVFNSGIAVSGVFARHLLHLGNSDKLSVSTGVLFLCAGVSVLTISLSRLIIG